MKAYRGSGGIVSRILDLGTRQMWMVSFTPRPLYPQGESPWYPLNRRLGGPQSRSGRGGENKNSQSLPRLEPLIIQSVAQCYTAELSWLLDGVCNEGYFRLEFGDPAVSRTIISMNLIISSSLNQRYDN
jgi:hypothetical protein